MTAKSYLFAIAFLYTACLPCAGAPRRQPADVSTLHITCWETFLVSNLTAQPVSLLPFDAVESAWQPIVCGSGVTAPVSVVWAGGATASAEAPAAAAAAATVSEATKPADSADARSAAASALDQVSVATWPCRVALQLSEARAVDESGSMNRASGGSGNSCIAFDINEDGPVVSLAEPCRRRWLALADSDKMPLQLAYRLLRSHGRHHLVLYVDQQPPLRVVSAADAHLEFGLTAPQHQGCACCMSDMRPSKCVMPHMPHTCHTIQPRCRGVHMLLT
jgi:hypothetical protein